MHLRALIHLTKVAGAVSLQRHIVVLGSSSLLASFADPGEPGNLLVSTYDADLLIAEMDDRSAKALDGIIGEDSLFREHFGYYADLLRISITDVLPPDWDRRLVPLPQCAGVLCLDPHDLAVAKLRAGRPKDLALLKALVTTGRLKAETIRERLDQTPMPEAAIVITYRGLREVEASGGSPACQFPERPASRENGRSQSRISDRITELREFGETSDLFGKLFFPQFCQIL